MSRPEVDVAPGTVAAALGVASPGWTVGGLAGAGAAAAVAFPVSRRPARIAEGT